MNHCLATSPALAVVPQSISTEASLFTCSRGGHGGFAAKSQDEENGSPDQGAREHTTNAREMAFSTASVQQRPWRADRTAKAVWEQRRSGPRRPVPRNAAPSAPRAGVESEPAPGLFGPAQTLACTLGRRAPPRSRVSDFSRVSWLPGRTNWPCCT